MIATSSRLSSRFSPRSLAPEQLERLTVAREGLLAALERVVVGVAASGAARFDVLIGPRGSGKSHCLGVLEGRLRASAQLTERAVLVAPPEHVRPTSLVSLLAAVLRELPDDPDVGPASHALQSLQRQTDGNQEQRAVDLIRGRLEGRSLIILLENLDELFEALGREGQQRLRNILQTQRRWSIVASSCTLSPAFVKYEAPFHGTFNQHLLEALSPEESRAMLVALAEAHGRNGLADSLRTPVGLARVRAIHHLIGGNPRALAFMFRQLDEQRLDRFELTLADLADDLAPYVGEQTARLSPAQRAIVQLLSESWRPLTVTEIAERSFTSQSSTSGALRHLRADALVQERKLGREHYYELGDPLHRLARFNPEIERFARLIREWYADEPQAVQIRPRYALPDDARMSSVAAEAPPVLSREAVARLAEPERELVRKVLERSDDSEGLVELGFTEPARSSRSQ